MRDDLDAHHLDILIRKYGEEVICIDTWILSPEAVLDTMLSHIDMTRA
jgi:hypothetical protein